MIEIVKVESLDDHYQAEIKRPDGSIVKVLIPREDSSSHASRCVSKHRKEAVFGLNLVMEGHYT